MLGALLTVGALAFRYPSGPRASPGHLPDIEDEVMCTICGTLLELLGLAPGRTASAL